MIQGSKGTLAVFRKVIVSETYKHIQTIKELTSRDAVANSATIYSHHKQGHVIDYQTQITSSMSPR